MGSNTGKKKWFSRKKETPVPASLESMPEPTWHSSITTLPLRNFIDASVTGNLSALIIIGYPGQAVLQSAWFDIQQEYVEAIGDNEQKMLIILMKDIAKLSTDLRCIELLALSLSRGYYKPMADDLNKLVDASFTFDWNDQEQYQKNLQRCLNRSKSIRIRLDLKQMNLKAMEETHAKKAAGKQEITPAYFQSILVTLSDHAKYVIADTITVWEFCERIKRFNEFVDHLKQSNGRSGTHR